MLMICQNIPIQMNPIITENRLYFYSHDTCSLWGLKSYWNEFLEPTCADGNISCLHLDLNSV